jgi:hypothetical protein
LGKSQSPSILAWDTADHGDLHDAHILTPNIRRKQLYRKMTIIIDGGPMGRGAGIEHPKCTVDGIHALAPDPDDNYMGHRND